MNIQKAGRYEIIRELGQGGQSIAYLARDPVIGRMVAIKLMRTSTFVSSTQQQQYMQRFLREAQAAGRLMHGNIAVIYDVGEAEGTPFIAMEYIEGPTLAELIQKEFPFPPDRVIRLISQVLNGLAYAHKNSIIHRDIKPGNIMVAANDVVKLVDFGIAKLDSSRITSTGHVLGTPSYMSPEQISGETVDRRSDIFSVGVVLYQCLSGRLPFPGEHATTVIYKIMHEPFAPLDIDSLRFPPQLDMILRKALAKKPEDRYSDCAEMERILAALPASFKQPKTNLEPDALNTVSLDLSAIPSASPAVPGKRFLTPLVGRAMLLSAALLLILILYVFRPWRGFDNNALSTAAPVENDASAEKNSNSSAALPTLVEVPSSTVIIPTTSMPLFPGEDSTSSASKAKKPIQIILPPSGASKDSAESRPNVPPTSSLAVISVNVPQAPPTTPISPSMTMESTGGSSVSPKTDSPKPSSAVWKVPVIHDHLVGGCRGTLVVTPDSLEFLPSKGNHYSKITLPEINRLNWRDTANRFRLSIQFKNGKEANYEAEGASDKELLKQGYEALLQNYLKLSR